ncbi:FYVE zinc finger-domain-containing protein [Pterulicium gracile]|uniref:FYVE zinc finger-domain-containing protein n=1 Tax=Pterulicium gracile TaxID=1884261 RepID=A0A5C3QD55_9AGAR|nr:FYVE zinc finger-domain-containing protein [Pterula gracilis]
MSSSSSVCHPHPTRANEHLAVLLPKRLWKADAETTTCDNFFCRIRFTMFERRHHCRKCGGVFCGSCAARATPLLDASKLDFIHPPRHSSIYRYETPLSPVVNSRVCEGCWEQIYGVTMPRTPELDRSSTPTSLSDSASDSSSLVSPMMASPRALHKALRHIPSSSSLSIPGSDRWLDLSKSERSYGELDAYPLKRSSALCKVTGGGRWHPKADPVPSGYRTPVIGGKAPFEIQMELEEAEERERRSNPIIRDGEFQYRVLREPETTVSGYALSSSIQSSTF